MRRLGLDHLIGTPTIKPYMHGYFLSLRLYDAARIIANPFAYAEHREKAIRDKMDKLAENRIRAPKDAPKVNKALAERVRKAEEREERRREKKRAIAVQTGEADVVAEEEEEVEEQEGAKQTNLLNDPRFQDLFVNPEYEVDTASREFGMLNPSTHDPSSVSPLGYIARI